MTSASTDCRGGGGEVGNPLGRECSGNFPWRKLHLATRVFLAGNHISDEQRDKVQEGAQEKNLKNLSEESLERRRRTP